MICYLRTTIKRIVKAALNGVMILLAGAGVIYTVERYTPETEAASVEAVQLSPEQMADRAALLNGINPALLRAVVAVESNWNAEAVSPKGAIGYAQIMPANAKRCGLKHPGKLWEPEINLACGAQILAEELANHELPDALRVYNGGPKALKRQFRESENYVRKVTERLMIELDSEVRL